MPSVYWEKDMSDLMDTVNQRTQMVGQNRLELLLFRLVGKQAYGINVFKVREVLQCPPLNEIPQRHPVVRGVAHIRGTTISIMDLSLAIGGEPLEDLSQCFVIIAEYNRAVQGFLVRHVERIVNLNWADIHPPPPGNGHAHYLTAVTSIEEGLVEIIDVERVLSEITPVSEEVAPSIIEEKPKTTRPIQEKYILVADDSTVARNQVTRTVEQLGLKAKTFKDGKETLQYLKTIIHEGRSVNDEVLLLISDIEMPEMDGYTLTAEIRNDDALKHLQVLLHTSLSGVFNKAMIEKVGADDFIPKFNPDELAQSIQTALEKI